MKSPPLGVIFGDIDVVNGKPIIHEKSRNATLDDWWSVRGSNSPPQLCHSCALPDELTPH